MGSSASKASRTAGAAARQYPTRVPPTTTRAPPPAPTSNAPASRPPPAQNYQPGPTVRPQPHASTQRSEAINLDASDPDFAASLRSIGPVQPNPTMSPTSNFQHPTDPNNPSTTSQRSGPDPRMNPALLVLDARSRLQEEADAEFMEAGKRGHNGREFLDVYLIRQILTLRDGQGRGHAEIEKRLGLKKGVVERLGAKGVVELAQDVGMADKVVRMV